MGELRIFLFGLPRFERDEDAVVCRGRKALALVAYLAMKKQPQSRNALCNLLWPEFDQARARNNLRRELSNLKSLLRDQILSVERHQVAFDPTAPVRVDVDEFLAELTRSRTLQPTDPERISALTKAVALYSADFLEGFYLPDNLDFEDWRFFEAESLQRAFVEALQSLIQGHIDLAQYDQGIEPCRRWLTLDPLYEPAQRQLMQLLAWSGDPRAAVRQYDLCSQLLEEELGTAPEAQTTALMEAIRAKKLAPPVLAITQPLRRGQPRHNLPASATPFVGRKRELARLDALLADPNRRLITILAPGGMGKTRLMLEFAQTKLNKFPHGVFLVDLGPLSEPGQIVHTLAHAMRYNPSPDAREFKQQVLDYLSHKHLLLLMDNLEHLLDGLTLIDEILQAAPQVSILATSRERLNLSSETVFELRGLDFPDSDASHEILDYSAGALFMQGARRAQPGFELREADKRYVAQICAQAGGLPLGILLAASWASTLSVEAIANEMNESIAFLSTTLRDVPERQRSIQAVFQSSWNRLPQAEREIIMDLSVFRGGMTREAIQKVTGATLRQLATLVNMAILQRNPETGRYTIHELLRQYAEHHLIASGILEQACVSHSRYFLNLLASMEADLKGRRQVAALNEIEADLENIRTAWRHAVMQADHDNISQALNSVFLFFDIRSRYQEAQEMFHFAIDQLERSRDPEQRFLVSRIQSRRLDGLLQRRRAPSEKALPTINAWLELAQTRGDPCEIAWCLALQSTVMWRNQLSDAVTREAALQKSAALFREANDLFWYADGLQRLGHLQHRVGNEQVGVANLQEALQLSRTSGNLNGMIWCLIDLGNHASNQDAVTAELYLQEAIDVSRQVNSKKGLANAQYYLSRVRFFAGDFSGARIVADEGVSFADVIDNIVNKTLLVNQLSLLASVADEAYEHGIHLATQSRDLSSQLETKRYVEPNLPEIIAAVGLEDYTTVRKKLRRVNWSSVPMKWQTMALCVYAILLAHEDQTLPAVERLSLAFSRPAHLTGWTRRWALMKRLQASLENELGTEAYNAAWERGNALDLDAILQEISQPN